MRILATLVAGFAALHTVGAAAQGTADPVAARFREYRAALDRKDFAAAEAAATAALEASEAADGANTAVLALNLATLRLSLAEPVRALEPAMRAHALATSGANVGVPPLLATLTLGRAELAADVATGTERLADAIGDAESQRQFLADAYAAAVTLGDWTLAANDYDASRAAWAAAARLSSFTTGDKDFARGRARLGEGVAIFLGGVNGPRGPSARNSAKATASPDAHAADAALSEAQQALRRLAYPAQPQESMTPAQTLFTQAMAWQGALRSKLESQDQELRDPAPYGLDPAAAPGAPPFCHYRWFADLPAYPRDALNRLGVGAVVLHTVFDSSGNVVRREVAAGVPTGAFVDSIRRSLTEWRNELDPSSPATCDASGSRYSLVRFIID